MAILFNSGRFKATDLSNAPISGAFLAFYASNTSTPQPIYTDPTLTIGLSNPLQSDGNGLFPEVWLDESLDTYKIVFSAPDINTPSIPGAVIWTIGQYNSIGGPQIPALLNPLTGGEVAADVTNYVYEFGDLRRYGATGDGVADDTAAWKTAIRLGYTVVPPGFSFLITSPAIPTGRVTVRGSGKTSKLLCDGKVLSITNGIGSVIDNLWMENVTTPYLITRDPSNWAASLTPTLSNGLGYQPTNQDPEYATWLAAQPILGTQNIGPVIQFQGAASDITVSRIYGRFVRIAIYDARNSVVRDCDFQGAKGPFSSIIFDNCTNNVQQGQNNQALNNRVGYSSLNGIQFFSNVDFTINGNTCYNCGESGISTGQSGGVAFTGSVGGLTSGTLNAPWASPTGTWTFAFSNGEIRAVIIATVGQTAVSWTGALASVPIANAAYWGINGSPASTMDPRTGRGLIINNRTYNNYYDGLDCDSTFGVTNDATQTGHKISNNYSFRNHGDGMNTDGQFNSIVGNHLQANGQYGIWGICSLTEIVGNFLIDNNQNRNPVGIAEILAVGALAQNKISDNYIWGGPTQNCPGISVTAAALNYVSDNVGVGVSVNNFGTSASTGALWESNVDNNSGASTPQSFCIQLVNNGGVLQHVFYADASASGSGWYSRINGASSGGFTTTPTAADSSTQMAAGLKIGATTTNALWFDTAAQFPTQSLMNAQIVFNNTTTAVLVQPIIASININGVTRQRLSFQFTNAATGAAFALTTGNIGTGKGIYVQFFGRLA